MSNSHQKHIGLLGISHESNTFINQVTNLDNFTGGHLFYGQGIIEEYRDAYHEIGGILEGLDQPQIIIVPIMYAEATPGGMVTGEAASYLVEKLLEELDKVSPLDGLMVVPHGAAVSEFQRDFDGYWLSLVRERLGSIPIMGTLDLHANVSPAMTRAVDAFIPYGTNPHIDQREVGKRAAELMVSTLAGEINPVQRLLPSQVTIGIDQQHTSSEPCASLYAFAAELTKRPGVLSVGILLGFPYADVPEMGTASLIVTDNRLDLAEEVGKELEAYIVQNRQSFVGTKISVSEAIAQVHDLEKPVLLLDMGDNVGGGSPGDGTFLLQALQKEKMKSFVCICDPSAVEQLKNHVPGDTLEMEIGGHVNDLHGATQKLEIRLIKMIDGRFHEKERRHGGQVHFDMGLSAIVETTERVTIMLTTKRMAPFSLQQLLQFDIDPPTFDAIVAKGVQAPIAAYASVCPSIIRVNTKGVTTADMQQLHYEKRRKPLFPFEVIETDI
ncbi:MAG: M81 family metallopeptidase [Saprospiraceae bacterium]|nr:M81 family metallopeptidase [Saprospiraceae bacterium]